MTFEIGHLYKHLSTLDVAIYIMVAERITLDGWNLRVRYWNDAYKTLIGEPEYVYIPDSKMSNWKRLY